MFSAYGSLWSRYVYERKDKLYSGISGIFLLFVVETKTAYGYNQSYSDETTAGQLSKTFPYILTSGALSDIVAESLGVDSIPASISAEAIQDTSIFTINVTASDPPDCLRCAAGSYPVLSAGCRIYYRRYTADADG